MLALRTANLIIAFIATTAPIAHALEMISKLTLDGPLWLGVQRHLYRGWGEVFGPVEIIASSRRSPYYYSHGEIVQAGMPIS